MDMGTRTAARIAAQGDFLTLVHFLSGRYQNLAQMTVAGLFAVRMADGDTVSVSSGPACADDGTAAGGSDCRSLRYCPVDSLVHTSPTPFECRSQGSTGDRFDVRRGRLGSFLDNLRYRFRNNIL